MICFLSVWILAIPLPLRVLPGLLHSLYLTLFTSLHHIRRRDAFIAATGCIAGDGKTLQENALALARMALAMQAICAGLTAPDGSPVVMRIGLHCGPLVAGVVGGSMLRYHLFGPAMDAVTQARRAAAPIGIL